MNIFVVLTSILLSLTTCHGSRLQRIHVDPSNGEFVDEWGRIRLFHGINSVIKGFPWFDEKILDPKRQQEIADLGINVIRLGAMWTGVEPEEGKTNKTYLDILDKIVSDFEALGIYTILDMHQDVLWQAGLNESEGYWGVPPWIKHKVDEPDQYFPWPMVQPTVWECGYFTQEINQGFGQFYENVNGVADDFANFWKILATRFGQQTSILGYELINEPGAGDMYKDLSLLLPGVAGAYNFKPLYERVSKAIRAIDDETIIFWEPALYSYFLPINGDKDQEQFLVDILASLSLQDILFILEPLCGELAPNFASKNPTLSKASKHWEDLKSSGGNVLDFLRENPSIFGTGFDTPPGGADYRNRSAMSWHYYCWGVYQGSEEAYNPLTKWFCDSIMGPAVFDTVKMRRKEVGGASFLTEFGVCYPNMSNPESVNTQECNFVLEQAERSFESWTYWDTASGYVFWDGQGNLNKNLVTYFSRPYPMATAGIPQKLSFDVYNKIFHYQFYPGLHFEGIPTEIYIPPIHYPERKFVVSTSPNLDWKFSEENKNVILIFNGIETSPDQLLFITISPKY